MRLNQIFSINYKILGNKINQNRNNKNKIFFNQNNPYEAVF